jgi:hypothetical protein
MRDLHVVAECFERPRRVLGGGYAVGMHDGEPAGSRGHETDPEPAGFGADLLPVGAGRWWCHVGVARHRTGDDVE